MVIYLAADHAGFALKEEVKVYLKGLGYRVQDQGPFEFNEDDDYPDFIKMAAMQVASDPGSYGIIFGLSGQGEAICANRFKGIRAAVYAGGSEEIISLSRMHNNANMLSIGVKFVSAEKAKELIQVWLRTPFSEEERHRRRIAKIDLPMSKENEF